MSSGGLEGLVGTSRPAFQGMGGQARPQGWKFCLWCLSQGANGTLGSEPCKGLCGKVESEFVSFSVFVNSVTTK